MKNLGNLLFGVLFLGAISILSTGCPVGIEYPLGKPGEEKIDARLLGTWVALSDSAEILKVKIAKATDYSYEVEVLESGENYMAEGTQFKSWATELAGKKFIYSQSSDSDEVDFYLYQYEFDVNRQLVIHDVSLLVGGTDAVTSTEAFRKEVFASLKMSNCLTAELKYRKE
ncbi:MAG: hypothetical protein AAB316_15375 [Bacteroidota bacterium]